MIRYRLSIEDVSTEISVRDEDALFDLNCRGCHCDERRWMVKSFSPGVAFTIAMTSIMIGTAVTTAGTLNLTLQYFIEILIV